MHYLKGLVPQSIKNIYHLIQSVLANFFYGFPSRKINPHTKKKWWGVLIKFIAVFNSNYNNFGVGVKVIGVTGTNGKTTTVQMIAKIFEEAGKKVAIASTINFKLGNDEWVNKTKYTTMSPFSVQKFIKRTVEAGCEYLILETSSHSLDQYRVWGVRYQTAVITNITREHLDYHKTMEKYRKAKRKLFEIVSKNNGNIIVNLDMENPEEFLKFEASEKFGYSVGHSEHGEKSRDSSSSLRMTAQEFKIIKAEDIETGIRGTKYKIQDTNFTLNLPGIFNVENSLAAVCVGISEQVNLETCSKALEKIEGISGRMENVPNEKGINVIVDYAVTPDSLEKLYSLLKKENEKNSKIIAVFGSCGERDRGKRPTMGEIVSKYADVVVITNEDPYFEDPLQIISEVSAGVKGKSEGKDFFKITDRREAIFKALSMAEKGDLVVVTGKGAEETMAIGKERIPWNDKAIILEELDKI